MNMVKNKGVTLIELAIVIAIFVATFIVLTPLVNMMKDRSNDIKCSNNIRTMSLALHMYAADHGDAFPAALNELYPDYIKEQKIFDCPAARAKAAPGALDYEYVPGLTEASSPSEIIICDKALNHGKRGRNIVRVNGLVEWVEGTAITPK